MSDAQYDHLAEFGALLERGQTLELGQDLYDQWVADPQAFPPWLSRVPIELETALRPDQMAVDDIETTRRLWIFIQDEADWPPAEPLRRCTDVG